MDVFFLGKEHLIHSLTEITHVVDRIIPGPTKWCQLNPKGWPIPSMYGIVFTYIWLFLMVKYGKCR